LRRRNFYYFYYFNLIYSINFNFFDFINYGELYHFKINCLDFYFSDLKKKIYLKFNFSRPFPTINHKQIINFWLFFVGQFQIFWKQKKIDFMLNCHFFITASSFFFRKIIFLHPNYIYNFEEIHCYFQLFITKKNYYFHYLYFFGYFKYSFNLSITTTDYFLLAMINFNLICYLKIIIINFIIWNFIEYYYLNL
jgi:hypothetical protein